MKDAREAENADVFDDFADKYNLDDDMNMGMGMDMQGLRCPLCHELKT